MKQDCLIFVGVWHLTQKCPTVHMLLQCQETLREDGRVSLVSGGKDTWGDWKNSDIIASYQV